MNRAILIIVILFVIFMVMKKTDKIITPSTGGEVSPSIREIIESVLSSGIVNPFAIAAILAVDAKESKLKPIREKSYKNTSNSRIREVFGERVESLSDSELNTLKKDDVKFFNYVYNGIAGNGPNDGYKYRGGGLNQLTGKGNYAAIGNAIGVDLLNSPDLILRLDVALKASAEYFLRRFSEAPQSIKSYYHFSSINSFDNIKDAVGAVYHANAGFGKSFDKILADATGGRKKAFDRASYYLNLVKQIV